MFVWDPFAYQHTHIHTSIAISLVDYASPEASYGK